MTSFPRARLLVGALMVATASTSLATAQEEADIARAAKWQDFAIPFAPPLDTPIYFSRKLTRETRGNDVRKKSAYELVFRKMGRGYVLEMQLIHVQTTGPEEIAELLAMGDRMLGDQKLVFDLSADGQILSVQDAGGTFARLRTAIEKARTHIAANDITPMAKTMHMAFLDRIVGMDEAAQQQYFMAMAIPVLKLAGQKVAGGVTAGDKHFRLDDIDDGNLVLASVADSESENVAVTETYYVSPFTGLSNGFDRETSIKFGGITRLSREEGVLSPEPPRATEIEQPKSAE
ncbi:hypothetical protein [Sphingorhabdus sp. Alg239-R122]|uniref:hypothetical protein n=1 Tax=Sphingorhabdus sp. Alg239-R122 TaxID=2305989 RepID=UPI0013DA73AC|nr:hypothetical protein [Sphingorhabdus sp. Alg239-R122]